MITIDLSGKTALVTGATGQLGRTLSKRLAQSGADVILCYHSNEKKAMELSETLSAECGVRTFPVQANIRDYQSICQMRDKLEKEFALPDIIVNCAVSQYQWVSILEQPIEDYQDQFETTVLHNVAMIKAFVPHMQKKGWGRVIGINTECAMQCTPTQSAYAAGKRGMDAIYRVLAREIGKCGITVNQIAPGWTFSDYERENGSKDINNNYTSSVPLGHRGTDDDIANALIFLASDLASFISGVYLPVCGGNVMPAI